MYASELEHPRTFGGQLRKKIEDDLRNSQYLLTDAYVGYRSSEQQTQDGPATRHAAAWGLEYLCLLALLPAALVQAID